MYIHSLLVVHCIIGTAHALGSGGQVLYFFNSNTITSNQNMITGFVVLRDDKG
jgi:hypothetical protein